jgi:hypothetical protein
MSAGRSDINARRPRVLAPRATNAPTRRASRRPQVVVMPHGEQPLKSMQGETSVTRDDLRGAGALPATPDLSPAPAHVHRSADPVSGRVHLANRVWKRLGASRSESGRGPEA